MGVEKIPDLSFSGAVADVRQTGSRTAERASNTEYTDKTYRTEKADKAPSLMQTIQNRNEETNARIIQEQASEEKYHSVMAENAVANANSRVRMMNTSAKFEYNEDIDRITIKIQDKDTNEIVREIPSEETQRMLEHIHTMRGLLMDQEV